MDLYLDKDVFNQSIASLKDKQKELEELRNNIEKSFDQLKKDWDSDAGKVFFKRFEDDLLNNLKKYALVFEYMSQNLADACQKYEEVFKAADAVTKLQY